MEGCWVAALRPSGRPGRMRSKRIPRGQRPVRPSASRPCRLRPCGRAQRLATRRRPTRERVARSGAQPACPSRAGGRPAPRCSARPPTCSEEHVCSSRLRRNRGPPPPGRVRTGTSRAASQRRAGKGPGGAPPRTRARTWGTLTVVVARHGPPPSLPLEPPGRRPTVCGRRRAVLLPAWRASGEAGKRSAGPHRQSTDCSGDRGRRAWRGGPPAPRERPQHGRLEPRRHGRRSRLPPRRPRMPRLVRPEEGGQGPTALGSRAHPADRVQGYGRGPAVLGARAFPAALVRWAGPRRPPAGRRGRPPTDGHGGQSPLSGQGDGTCTSGRSGTCQSGRSCCRGQGSRPAPP